MNILKSLLQVALIALIGFAPRGADASADRRATAAICENAARVAARESGVPLDVLRAISLTETGRKNAQGFLPWPWTVNMEGAGRWFEARGDARAYVDKHFARGARSFDVGCFQINYRWHGHAFASIEEMFDPLANARYAASFLRDLHDEFGDWSKAAGAYHSRTPKYARKYAARFDRIRSRLTDIDPVILVAARPQPEPEPSITPTEMIARINRYPLLQAGAPSTRGSLVPLNTVSLGRLIDMTPPEPLLEMP